MKSFLKKFLSGPSREELERQAADELRQWTGASSPPPGPEWDSGSAAGPTPAEPGRQSGLSSWGYGRTKESEAPEE